MTGVWLALVLVLLAVVINAPPVIAWIAFFVMVVFVMLWPAKWDPAIRLKEYFDRKNDCDRFDEL